MSFASPGPSIVRRLSSTGEQDHLVPLVPVPSTTSAPAGRITALKRWYDRGPQINIWLEEILDRLTAGIFLVQGGARIIHANARGRAVLAQGDVVRDSNGKLSAVELQADRALRSALAAVRSRDGAGTRGIAIPLPALSGERFVAHVLHLRARSFSSQTLATSVSASVAIVSLRKATLDLAASANALVSHYRLTAAELRVSMAIVEVGGVPEVAQLLGICETTVKTHLQRVFEKTGANRQAELVKLVAELVCPFD
jgi:DNA-binding CsgD family transcriptional regulator